VHQALARMRFLEKARLSDDEQMTDPLPRNVVQGLQLHVAFTQSFRIGEETERMGMDIPVPFTAGKGLGARCSQQKGIVMAPFSIHLIFLPTHCALILHDPALVVIVVMPYHHEGVFNDIEEKQQQEWERN